MSGHPLDGAMLVVIRVPLTIGFDNDVLYSVRGRVQDATEVSVRRLARTWKKLGPVDLPIEDQLFWFQHLLADRAKPSRRLLHHAVPRRCIKALGMDTFLRPGGEADASIAQLFAAGMKLLLSKLTSRELTGHFSDIFCSPATISSSSATLCFPEYIALGSDNGVIRADNLLSASTSSLLTNFPFFRRSTSSGMPVTSTSKTVM